MSRVASLFSILLFVVTLVGCDGSGGMTAETTPDSPSPAETFSGVDLYKGLMFGEGEVAQKFPEIWKRVPSASDAPAELSSEETRALVKSNVTGMSDEEIRSSIEKSRELKPQEQRAIVDELETRVIQDIKERNPQFFEKLHASLTSGNHRTVQAAMPKMANQTVIALSNVLQVSPEAVRGRKKMNIDGLGKCIDTFPAVFVGAVSVIGGFTVAAANLFAVYNIDIAVDKAAVYDEAVWWGGGRNPEPETESKRLENEMIVDMVTTRLAS